MTREERTELIKHLQYERSIGADYIITDEDANEIIKALEQEPCEDAISRQAAIEEIRFGQSFITKIHPTGEIEHLFDKENKALEAAVERIEAMPSVTPKQRAGHWIETWTGLWCSECNKDVNSFYNYCPNCGAEMQEEEE